MDRTSPTFRKSGTPFSFPASANSRSPETIGSFSTIRMTPSSSRAASDPFTDPPVHQDSSQPTSESTTLRLRRNQQHGALSSAATSLLTQGERIKAMIECIKHLRYLGVESEAPLPKICVVGDQSAGKSSLVEALSGIKVPHAEGCCTRCPVEVNLIGTEVEHAWECRVFLVKEYDYLHNSQTSHKATRKHPMGRWSPRAQHEVVLFGSTWNKDEVCDFIHHAQLAVLNPGATYKQYLPGAAVDGEEPDMEVKFSPNVIRLDIQSPDFSYNLSFTDLPGIITMSENKSEKFLVEVVANLMKEHIKRKSCIVILTLPMTTDVENSTAFSIIRDQSAEERTLGVLTKPDRIQSQLTRWHDMLLDRSSFRLGHGYHAVMMHPETNLSQITAPDQEKLFFEQENWQAMRSTAPEKLGIPSLTEKLERLLATKISEDLPNIISKVDTRFLAIQNELKKYPERPSVDRYQIELVKLISRFGFELMSLFDGPGRGTEASPLKYRWATLREAFRTALLASRPSLEISTAAERKALTKLRANNKQPSTPVQNTKASDKTQVSMEISSDDEDPIFAAFKKPIRTFKLETIKECNERWDITHIPGQIAPRAIEDLNRLSVAHWKTPASELVDHVGNIVREEVEALVADVFSAYQNTGMYTVALNAVESFLEKALEDQKVEVMNAYRMEHEHPFTLDDKTLIREKSIAMKKLTAARLGYRMKLAEAKSNAESPAKKPKVVEEKDLEQDLFGLHIEIMAIVRAYYQIAASRFADGICLGIQARLFAKCSREMEDAVEQQLRTSEETSDAKARIVRLMSDDPQSEVDKIRLIEELNRLHKAKQHLERVLGGGHEMDDTDAADASEQIGADDVSMDGTTNIKMEQGTAQQTRGKRKRSPETTVL